MDSIALAYAIRRGAISRTAVSVRLYGAGCRCRDDGAGQKLTYVHFEDEPGRQSAAKLLTRNEARRIIV